MVITFNESHRVSEARPIPYDVSLLVKWRFEAFKGMAVCKLYSIDKQLIIDGTKSYENAFTVGSITHFQRIEN